MQRKSSGPGEGVATLSSPSSSSPTPTKAEDPAPEEKRFKPEPHSAAAVREEFRSPGSPLFSSSDMKPPPSTTTQNGSARFLDRFPFLSGASASDVFVSAQLMLNYFKLKYHSRKQRTQKV